MRAGDGGGGLVVVVVVWGVFTFEIFLVSKNEFIFLFYFYMS